MIESKVLDSINLAEPAELSASKKQSTSDQPGERQQLIVFRLAEENFAISIDSVKEVVLTPAISRVPQSPHYIEGVANIRGTIITIMNLEKRLNMISDVVSDDGTRRSYKYTLVLDVNGKNVGILVDRVPNTLNVKTDDINAADEAMSAHIADSKGSYLKGIVKESEKMIFLLNISELMG